jgi:hypothetical protein
MIPSFIGLLTQMPLTSNGKLDRSSLPTPGELERRAQPEFVPPSTSTEKLLARIWAELLDVPKVGIHDDFFDLGGHSLLAMRAANTVSQLFRRPIDVGAVLRASTVGAFREYLYRQEQVPGQTDTIAEVLMQALPVEKGMYIRRMEI